MRSSLSIILLVLLLASVSAADQSSSYNTTEGFYDWYIKAGLDYRDNFAQAQPYFTKELFTLLSKGFKNGPDDGFWIDFDPFINAQVDAERVSVGKPYTAGNGLDMVKVTPLSSRPMDAAGNKEMPVVKVYCVKQGSKWVIGNLVYPGDPEMGVEPWNLKDHLKKGLGILSSGNDPGYVGEDPATMLAIEEVLPGQWLFLGISSNSASQTLAPPKKTLFNFTADNRISRQDDGTASGTWTSGEGHLEWRIQGEPLATFEVEKFGEMEMKLKNVATGYFWVLRKL